MPPCQHLHKFTAKNIFLIAEKYNAEVNVIVDFFLPGGALNTQQAKVEDLIDDSLWLPGLWVRPLSAVTVEWLFHE